MSQPEKNSKQSQTEEKSSLDKKNGFITSNWFYATWIFLFLSLIVFLFYAFGQLNSDFSIQKNSLLFFSEKIPNDNVIMYLKDYHKELEKSFFSNFEDKIGSKISNLQQSINLISIVTGLFGVLITAVSIFFSLKESIRVDKLSDEIFNQLNNSKKELKELSDEIFNQLSKNKEDFKELITENKNHLKEDRDDLKKLKEEYKAEIDVVRKAMMSLEEKIAAVSGKKSNDESSSIEEPITSNSAELLPIIQEDSPKENIYHELKENANKGK